MSYRRSLASVGVVSLATSLASAGSSPVVARVGKAELTARAVEAKIQSMPKFQLRTFGDSDREIARHVTDHFIVPDVLFARAARDRGLHQQPAVRARLDDALSRALQHHIADKLRQEHPLSDEAVAEYYESHRKEFVKPERLRLWRILVEDSKDARRILEAVTEAGTPQQWEKLARQHSLDEATRMRRGDLGFVRPDGHTDVPQVRVDPSLYAAAKKVADGQIVSEPVQEGDRLAIVWRRGSLPAVRRSLKAAAPAIRQVLERKRLTETLKRTVRELRQKHLGEVHPELLDDLEVPEPSPAGSARPSLPPQRSADPVPRDKAGGLR